MKSIWLKGLKGQDKEKRKAEVLGYRNAFEIGRASCRERV